MTNKSELGFGSRVRFSERKILKRQDKRPQTDLGRYDTLRFWAPAPYYSYMDMFEETFLEGIVIGKRSLANGKVIWGWEDTPTVFSADERISAYLVAYDLRRKPVYVLEEDIELVEEESA